MDRLGPIARGMVDIRLDGSAKVVPVATRDTRTSV
jgi:hypothetical protein